MTRTKMHNITSLTNENYVQLSQLNCNLLKILLVKYKILENSVYNKLVILLNILALYLHSI